MKGGEGMFGGGATFGLLTDVVGVPLGEVDSACKGGTSWSEVVVRFDCSGRGGCSTVGTAAGVALMVVDESEDAEYR